MMSNLASTSLVLAAMGLVALMEAATPLHPRGRWSSLHVAPNLALTLLTFATNLCFGAGLVGILVWLDARGTGLLRLVALPPAVALAVTVLALDFAAYLAHVVMHWSPPCWRFHRMHHADPTVDVTTAFRQHPGESVIRSGFAAALAVVLGATPGAYALYRLWSALQALLEHANVRLPPWLDHALSLVVVSPNMHKVHHSRAAAETNTNYGNIFSLFDRACSTFTPAACGTNVVYGLDGFDDPAAQTTAALLTMPFRTGTAARAMTSTTRSAA